jgi:hypothetical protein
VFGKKIYAVYIMRKIKLNVCLKDKERMAQLLRNKTQNESGCAVKISQYGAQVDSLTHMLEALTQSKELVAQELAVARAANCEVRLTFMSHLFIDFMFHNAKQSFSFLLSCKKIYEIWKLLERCYRITC